MRNNLNMNLYRMKKTRLSYVLFAVAVLISLLLFGIELLLYEELQQSYEELPIPMLAPPANFYAQVASSLSYGIVPMIAVMFVLIFFNNEFSSGYVKNLIGCRGNKIGLCAANLLTAALFAAATFLATVLICFILTLLVIDNRDFSGFGKFVVYLAVYFIATMGYILLLLAIADRKGKYVPAMILGALYVNYAPLIYLLIEMALAYFFKIDISVGKYTLLGCINTMKPSSDWKDLILSAAIALAAFIGAFFLDVNSLKKRELK